MAQPQTKPELIDLFDKDDKEETLKSCLRILAKYRPDMTEKNVRRAFFQTYLEDYCSDLSPKQLYVVSTLADIAFDGYELRNPVTL